MVTRRRRSRIDGTVQVVLLEHFVAGTPARAAAALVGVNRHTATLFYHNVREVIAAHLALDAPIWAARSRPTKPILAEFGRASEDAVPLVKYPSSGCLSALARCMR